jgi:putative sterol carrier protein
VTLAESWRKSSYSANECVEVAFIDGSVVVRDSKHPDRTLIFSPQEWSAFTAGVKACEFDLR